MAFSVRNQLSHAPGMARGPWLFGGNQEHRTPVGPPSALAQERGCFFLVVAIGVQTALCTGEVSFSPSAHRDSLSSSFRDRPQLGIDISDSCYRRGAQRPRREGQGAECSLSGQHCRGPASPSLPLESGGLHSSSLVCVTWTEDLISLRLPHLYKVRWWWMLCLRHSDEIPV